ncbi:hypothetical protein TNCV_2021961 [Trichonephila clavipes]|nr:hypothetical protein TNCV_2021961 [Trichonephila clavipes]
MIKANRRITIDGVAEELGIGHEGAQKMQSPEFFLGDFLKLIKRYGKCPNVHGISLNSSNSHRNESVESEKTEVHFPDLLLGITKMTDEDESRRHWDSEEKLKFVNNGIILALIVANASMRPQTACLYGFSLEKKWKPPPESESVVCLRYGLHQYVGRSLAHICTKHGIVYYSEARK